MRGHNGKRGGNQHIAPLVRLNHKGRRPVNIEVMRCVRDLEGGAP
jgi:hypothetical protein